VGDRLDLGFKHWFNREDIAGEMAEAGLRMEWYGVDGYGWAVGTRPAESIADRDDHSSSTAEMA
jgi:hypothetical protein